MRTVPAEHQPVQSFAEAAEFARAWSNPRSTHITLEPVDVNRVLKECYALARELTFTRAMLWEIEVRKARDPPRYIPTVVQEGTCWAFQTAGDREQFLRASQQRQ